MQNLILFLQDHLLEQMKELEIKKSKILQEFKSLQISRSYNTEIQQLQQQIESLKFHKQQQQQACAKISSILETSKQKQNSLSHLSNNPYAYSCTTQPPVHSNVAALSTSR